MTPPPIAPELLDLVAERFRVLSEPARLRLLNAVREGEKTVSGLVGPRGFGGRTSRSTRGCCTTWAS
ncbi:MAG TPA: hypothetical protein VFR37_10920 [Longimicrobium sp.]|nr:hypothetical protein [Longimicrobium sp.]